MSVGLSRWMALYAVAAGACDTTTGLLLVSAPQLTLKLMGIAAIPGDLVLVRFVGAFVGGVGLVYLYPFALDRRSLRQRTRVVLEATAVVRACVALFVTTAVVAAALEVGWSTVAVFDGLLALAQIVMVRQELSDAG